MNLSPSVSLTGREMTAHFDPYHKWLGIPPQEQPANHYRLLGVQKFESDREVIDAAANRLMAYLQEMSTGENADEAQRLLNQISAVRLILLSPEKKSAYDSQLRVDAAPVARAIPANQPPMAKALSPPPAPAQGVAATPQAPAPSAPNIAQPPAGAPPTGAGPAGGPVIVTDDSRPGGGASRPRAAAKPRKAPSFVPLILLAIAAVIIGAVAIYILTQQKPATEQKQSGGGSIVIVEEAPIEIPKTDTRLRIQLAASEREDIVVSIDRRIKRVAQQGLVEFDVSPGAHRLKIRRDGYFEIEQEVAITKGEIAVFQPVWKVDENSLKATRQFDIPEDKLNQLDDVKPAANDQDADAEKLFDDS